MAKETASINLVKPKFSFTENLINWALSIGRGVVILTEFIALSAFLYRFTLDRELIDLHSKIKQEQAVVSYLKENEASYRNLQDRLILAAKSSEEAKSKMKLMEEIIRLVPEGIVFSEFNLTAENVKITANVYSLNSLTSFINSLKKQKEIESVSIDKIENKSTSGVINVSISAGFRAASQDATANNEKFL